MVVRPLDTEGEFDKKSWTATIDEPLFSGPRPGGGWAHRAAVIAHEARHCEQAFLAARLMAGRGRSWSGIVKELQIPEDVAKAARERPLARDDPQAEEAAVFLRSMTGFGAIREAQVMKRLAAAKDEYREALLAYERAAPADKPAMKEAMDAAYAKVQEAEAAYRALPGEADAFELSDDVLRAFRDLPP